MKIQLLKEIFASSLIYRAIQNNNHGKISHFRFLIFTWFYGARDF